VVTVGGTQSALAAQSPVQLVGTGYQSGYGLVDQGPSNPDITVTDQVYLGVRDAAALADQARAVSTPGSPSYREYLTQNQIQAENQLTPAQLNEVRGWLVSDGLTVTQPNWQTLTVTGTLGQLGKAFDVTFDSYADPDTTDPYVWQIPTTDMSVPADLAQLVDIVGTNTFPIAKPVNGAMHAPLGQAAIGSGPGTGINRPGKLGGVSYPHVMTTESAAADAACSTYWGQRPATGVPAVNGQMPEQALCGYTPNQIRSAEGLDNAALTGKGQTVAVVTPAYSTIEQDVDTWSSHVGTQPLRPGQLTVVPTPDGSTPPPPQEAGAAMVENTLDVEAVHGMAPDAKIISVGLSTSNDGTILDSVLYILDHTNATIASLSLASSTIPGLAKADDQAYQEGALKGVGFYYSSGDGGHDPTTGSYLNPLAGSDWVTGVGGTSLGIGADGSREWETGWGDPISTLSKDGTSWNPPQFAEGAGGGWMTGQPAPWYQQGVLSAREATGPDGGIDRTGPDVAMDADASTGMLVGGTVLGGSSATDPSTWKYAQGMIGGTSLSTPLFAGIQALAQQGGRPIGFANPLMYRLSASGAFRDITALTGPAPASVLSIPISPTQTAPYLFQAAGRMQDGLPTTPQTGTGFDTETGLGVPTAGYLETTHRR
jgi:subtilase family serine protease